MSELLNEYIIEIIEKETLVSEGLRFHIEENLPISINIYRRGSENYFNLFNEARDLYKKGLIELNHEIDKMYINELDVGEWDYYKGQLVPLDYPMIIGEENLVEAKYKGKKVRLGKSGARRVRTKAAQAINQKYT